MRAFSDLGWRPSTMARTMSGARARVLGSAPDLDVAFKDWVTATQRETSWTCSPSLMRNNAHGEGPFLHNAHWQLRDKTIGPKKAGAVVRWATAIAEYLGDWQSVQADPIFQKREVENS